MIFMIEEIHVKNFRSLKDFKIEFEEDITVLVGENDSGKTSVIDAIKIIFNKKSFGHDDFSYDENEALIELKIDDKIYIKDIKLIEGEVEENLFIKLNEDYINQIEAEISSNEFDSLEEDDKRGRLFELLDELGITRGNMRKIETLTEKITGKITELKNNEYIAPISGIPADFNIFFLDGKKFENIDEHINELYFNQIKQDIWEKEVAGKTIEQIIDDQLTDFATSLETKMEEQGSITKLKDYLPNITSLKIIPSFTRRLTLDVDVQLKEGEITIPVENKGDGTKRRITMALLEIKKEIDDEQSDAYIFDEPNTHLHVKAELDLLKLLLGFVKKKKQVFITTHSPFLLNSVNPQKIRLLTLDDNQSKVSQFKPDEILKSVLSSLGINNTNLFFSKKILIVEGHTENNFVPIIFQKIYGIDLQNILVNLINGKGIETAAMAARVFRDFNLVERHEIYVLIDNDGNKKLKRFIEVLDIPQENIRQLGYKEFEDTFDPLIIYESWKKYIKLYLNEYNPEIYEKFENRWTYDSIKLLRKTCIENDLKFSDKLADFSIDHCLVRMDKTDLGIALAKHAQKEDLDPKLNYILDKLF